MYYLHLHCIKLHIFLARYCATNKLLFVNLTLHNMMIPPSFLLDFGSFMKEFITVLCHLIGLSFMFGFTFIQYILMETVRSLFSPVCLDTSFMKGVYVLQKLVLNELILLAASHSRQTTLTSCGGRGAAAQRNSVRANATHWLTADWLLARFLRWSFSSATSHGFSVQFNLAEDGHWSMPFDISHVQ
jgi:hypothetical protein